MSTETEAGENNEEGGELPGADRPRGILTQSDREWLAGEKEFGSRAGLHKARSRVMERLLNGTHDFQYLLNWEEEQRREAFQVEKEGTATYRPYRLDDEIGESATDAVAFYLRTADDAAFPTEDLLEAAFVEAKDEVAEANVAVDLRDENGEVLRTFHIEDGQIVHQETAPGALELGSTRPDEESEEEEKLEETGTLGRAFNWAADAWTGLPRKVTALVIYLYLGAFAWAVYQRGGILAVLGVFTVMGVVSWLIDAVANKLRGFSEVEDPSAWDGLRAVLGFEDTDEEATTDGGLDTTQEAAP